MADYDAAKPLKDFKPKHKFFLAVDSDGSAFDSMEIKHKECFIPNIIKYWNLQGISKYVRQTAEFVNLYSKWRGKNRFPCLLRVFDLLAEREEVKKRGIKMPEVQALRDWVKTEPKLGNPALEKKVAETNDPVLKHTLEWSKAVNATIADIVKGVAPMAYVRESLAKAREHADIMVVSTTPYEALEREWAEHDIAKYVEIIGAQEMGTKPAMLGYATKGKYEQGHILMIGDGPGTDMRAAKENNAFFYPINPGHEEDSWKRFYEEAFDKFIEGTYAGQYQEMVIEEFNQYLPEDPPWSK